MYAPVIALDHPAALDAARVGREAAGLAAARAAGLPVLAGVVLTADWATDDRSTAEQVWRITSHDGRRPLVLRLADVAGRRHHIGEPATPAPTAVVHCTDDLLAAAATWRAGGHGAAPLLLHPEITGAWCGALFADGHSGRRSTPLVVARRASADGDWTGVLDDAGRIRDVLTPNVDHVPPARLLARLTRLATRTAEALGGSQDLDWVADADDRVSLLRVRPIVRRRVSAPPPCPRRVEGRGSCRAELASPAVPGRPRSTERTRGRDRRVA